MYEEYELTNQNSPELLVAKRRVVRNLDRLGAASQRTLESKISESGRGLKPAPHLVYYAIRSLLDDGTVAAVHNGNPCKLYALADQANSDLVSSTLSQRLALERLWRKTVTKTSHAKSAIGKHGEQMLLKAFVDASFFAAPSWGNVTLVNNTPIPSNTPGIAGSVDGVVIPNNLTPAEGTAIVEIKNTREWIYPASAELWDIIRNGFAVNAVPIIAARKIYATTFTYVLSRIGGLGLQTHNQLVPPHLSTSLQACKGRLGLGFKDILFVDSPPLHISKAARIIADQIVPARAQMSRVRSLVEPFLGDLANPSVQHGKRRAIYKALQHALDRGHSV